MVMHSYSYVSLFQVTTASVKLCLRENDVTKNEKHHNDSGVLLINFLFQFTSILSLTSCVYLVSSTNGASTPCNPLMCSFSVNCIMLVITRFSVSHVCSWIVLDFLTEIFLLISILSKRNLRWIHK